MYLPAAFSWHARLASFGKRARHRYVLTPAIPLLVAAAAVAEDQATWKTGRALETQLKQQFSIRWEDRPLRPALERLAREAQASVFLDRRIDPDQRLSLNTHDLPLAQLYDQIAAAAQCQTCRIGPVVYFGPPATAARLSAVAAQRRADAGKLPTPLRERLLKQAEVHWPELSQPRMLISGLAAEAGLTVENESAVPHDLWPAIDLPPLPWTDRLSLVLAGFDLTFEIAGVAQKLTLVPLPRDMPTATPATAKKIAAKRPAKAGMSVYTLRATGQPIGSILKTIADNLGKKLTYDPAHLEKLRQPASFNLTAVPLETLLETALASSGLSYEITDNELRITGP